MKKVLSLVLVIAMVLSSMSFAFAGTFTDMTDNDYSKAVNALAGLGVVTGYEDGTYRPGKTVTRAEMAKLMVEILGYGDLVAGAKSNFADTQGHWADPWIAIAAGRGIVIGTGAGNFTPDKTVSYDEVLTMIVRGLGYTDDSNEIKTMPWPTNFKIKAAELGITDSVKLNTTGADRGGVAQALYNALECSLVAVDNDGNVAYMKDLAGGQKLLLSRIADPATITVSPAHLDKSSKLYAGNVVDLAPYMYQTLNVYVNKNDNDEVIYVKSSSSLVVEGTVDKVDTTAKTINVKDADGNITKVYYDGIDGEKVVAPMFKNGVTSDSDIASGDITGTVFKAFDSIKVVGLEAKDDSNGRIDGNEIKGFVVADQTAAAQVERGYVSGKTKFDRFNLPVNSSDKVNLSKVTVTGAVDSLEDIQVDDVVVEYAGKNESGTLVQTKLVVSRDTVEGKITRDDSANGAFYINGTKYSTNGVANPALALGDEGVFFLDHNGDIVAFDGTSAGPTNYAVVLSVAPGSVKTDRFNDQLLSIKDYPQIKLATAEGDVVVYDIYTKFDSEAEAGKEITAGPTFGAGKTYYVSYDSTADAGKELEVNANLVTADTDIDSVLVKYSLNKDGKVSKLTIVGQVDKDFDTTKSTFKLASNALIFDANANSDGDYLYPVISKDRLESKLTGADVVYNSKGEIEVLVTSDVKAGSAKSYARLDKIETGYNADDEEIQIVTVYMNGAKVTLNNESSKEFTDADLALEFVFDLDGNDITKVEDPTVETATIADISFGTGMIDLGTWMPLAENVTVVKVTNDKTGKDATESLKDIYDLEEGLEVHYIVDGTSNEVVFITIDYTQVD